MLRDPRAANKNSYLIWFKPASEGPASLKAHEIADIATQACTEYYQKGGSPQLPGQSFEWDIPGLATCYDAAIRSLTNTESRGLVCMIRALAETAVLTAGDGNAEVVIRRFLGGRDTADILYNARCYMMLEPI